MLEVRVEHERKGFLLAMDLTIGEGTLGVIGPSGAGKTTLLHLIAGLNRPTRGRIVLDREVLFDRERGIDKPPHERGVAMVFQDVRLFPHMSVRRNLQFGSRRPGPEGPSLEQILHLLELEPYLERYPSQLSGGQAKRVALGRALLSHPSLLLLDEPLAGLDRELAARLLPYLLRIRQALRIPALLVSHTPEDVLALADDLVVIRDGGLVSRGDPAELLAQPGVFSMAAATGIDNILPGRVESCAGSLCQVAVEGATWSVIASGVEVGEEVQVGIRSRDILLGLEPLPRVSARNRWEGEIAEIHIVGDRALAYVEAGSRWVVELTVESVDELSLQKGTHVHLAVKTAAVELLGRDRLS